MIQDRLRLIGLALLVFVLVPYLVLRHLDKAEQAKQSMAGKTVVVHYWGVPPVALNVGDQITMAIYKRFLDKPENKDLIVQRFSGLEIKDLPASWDAMMQMAFAADRAPDVLQLVTENIQTHRAEGFVRPMPGRFTFEYSNAAYDDDSGYRSDAAASFRAERTRQGELYAGAREAARRARAPEEQWLANAALAFDSALMRKLQEISTPAGLLPRAAGHPPHLLELLDAWNDLMRRSDQPALATTRPEGEPAGEPLTPQQAWARWLFEKLQAKIPADLLRALYDMKAGQLYGSDEGEPGLMGINYRIKPFREASLTDRAGRVVLPQTWDELEYWSIAISLMGEGVRSDGKVGYKLAHGQLIPYPFPLYAYGAGGLMVTQNPDGAWSCALDSPGTIRGMTWIRRMAFLRPIKIDYPAVDPQGRRTIWPLLLVYDRKSPFFTVPDFYLRSRGEAQQVVIRRLTLTGDWRVMDRDRELFRFASRQDLIDQLKQPASQSPGQCSPVRPFDKNDLDVEKRLWDEDMLAMTYSATHTLVVPNPEAEGRSRHPDGPPWDLMVTDAELKDAASLRQLQAALAGLGVKVDLSIGDGPWADVAAFLKGLAAVADPAARRARKAKMPADLARVLRELARVNMPADLYYPHLGLKPARPAWADPVDVDRDRSGRWAWVHLASPDGATIVTVQQKYVVQRAEHEAWPGGPRFTQAPTAVEGGAYVQFLCGLQVPAGPGGGSTVKNTYRLQVAVVDMGMLALNQRLNSRTEDEARRLDAAIRLISYLSSDEAEKISTEKQVENGLGLTLNPVLLRKYGFNQIADQIPADYEEAMRNIRRIGRSAPAVPNYRGFQQFLANLGDRIIIQGEDPAEACKLVTATVNKRFLSEPDPRVMVQRRKVAWVIFALVAGSLLLAGAWMGRQLIRGVSVHVAKTDEELGSVGQRPTWRTHLAAWIFLGPAVLTVFIWSYVPLGWGSVMAFQDFHVIKPTQVVGLDNFIRIFVDPQFYVILWNTFYFTLLSLGLGFLAPIVLALMLNEIPWGKIFYRTVFYLPAITSGLVILFMWKRFYQPDKFGLLNSLLTGLNDLNTPTVFVLKALGVLAVPGIIVLLYHLPMTDDIETRLGRFLAAVLPVALTLWLGYRAPGEPFFVPERLLRAQLHVHLGFFSADVPGAMLILAPLAVACLLAGLALLVAAYRAEHEFASRRIPWAAPGIATIFVAGWLLRGAAGGEVSPQFATSHMAQLFALMLPVIGLWPILRKRFGREATPRETMYLVFRRRSGAAVSVYSPRGRGASVAAGGAIALLAVAGFALADSPTALAFRQLIGHGTGWLFQPFIMEPLLWLKDRDLAMLCIILPGVWAGMGPGCLIYLAGLKGIPEDVYEAADLDGATAFQKTWTITVPHLMALLIINFVGAFIGAFQASQNVLVMTAGGPADATMVLGLEVWMDAFVLLKFGYATALAWILGLILIGFTMYQVSILKKVQFKTSGMK